LVASRKQRSSRKSERGTTVVLVVMVTTLITAIGMFAVRNISQIDQAVGFSRQSVQTTALAELGTTAAMAQMVAPGSNYPTKMVADNVATLSTDNWCQANGGYAKTLGSTCYRLKQSEIEDTTTKANGAETLLEPAVAGSESGSFGPLSNITGFVSIELTDRHQANGTPFGTQQGKGGYFDVTLTTTANVRPITTDPDECGASVPAVTVKKVLRAHVIVPGEGTQEP
jgi:hypothetical protein